MTTRIGSSMKVIPLVLACLLSGCGALGAFVVGNDETAIKNPLETHRGALQEQQRDNPELTTEQLRQSWGPPDWIDRLEDGSEQWRYNFGLRWNGVAFWIVFIPVPILVPVGYEHVDFFVEKGLVARATTEEHNIVASYGCFGSFIPIHGSNGACSFGKENPRGSRFYQYGNPPGGFKP